MKKRYKTLIGFIITGIILIIIFFITKDRKIYYLALGDFLTTKNPNYSYYVSEYLKDKESLEFYTNSFTKENYRSIDLLNDLKNNKKIKVNNKEITIKNALIKADLVTVSIGLNDIFYKFNLLNEITDQNYDIYKYIDECMEDINKLLYELRISCKEEIIILGVYNPFTSYDKTVANDIEPVIVYADNSLRKISNKYDMTYLELHDMFLSHEEYLPNKLSIYPTKEASYAISKKIIRIINKKKLAN